MASDFEITPTDGAIHENLVPREKLQGLLEDRQELIAKRVHRPSQPSGTSPWSHPDARVAGRESRSGEFFEELVEFFAFLERVEQHRPRPDIEAVRPRPIRCEETRAISAVMTRIA